MWQLSNMLLPKFVDFLWTSGWLAAAQRSYACKVSLMPWQLLRRHPAYICVPLSEWDVWVCASSVPQGRLSWHNLLIWVQPWRLCIDHLEGDSAVFFSPLSRQCVGSGRSCRASAWRFRETKCYCVVGLCWHCFLPISDFNRSWSRLWRLVRAASFLFSRCAKNLWNYRGFVFLTYHLFTGNLSPDA